MFNSLRIMIQPAFHPIILILPYNMITASQPFPLQHNDYRTKNCSQHSIVLSLMTFQHISTLVPLINAIISFLRLFFYKNAFIHKKNINTLQQLMWSVQ